MKNLAIHAMLLPDGQVLIHGATEKDGQGGGVPGNVSYEIWNIISGDHFHPQNHVQITYDGPNIFCSTANIDVSTGNVIIMGGDDFNNNGITDTVEIDAVTLEIRKHPKGGMKYPRWYGTSVQLPDGRIFVVGGSGDDGNLNPAGIPEIWSPEEGFRDLPWANVLSVRLPILDLHWNNGWWYPNVFVNSAGEIIVTAQGMFASLAEIYPHYFGLILTYLPILDSASVYKIEVEGKGWTERIGTKPFSSHKLGPSIMYRTNKAALLDNNGWIWSMDISPGRKPSYEKMIHTGFDRRTNAVFALLPDGRVTLTGGCESLKEAGNTLTGAVYTLQIWDPVVNTIFHGPDMDVARLYHSSSIILPDGTVFNGGGGASGPQFNDNGQIYYPGYLFNDIGTPATRPVIESFPKNVQADTIISIRVNDFDIDRVTATKSGHMTHAHNPDARWLELDFTVENYNLLKVTLPNKNIMIPGLWNLNVLDTSGVPSVAVLIGVNMADLPE